MITLEEKYKQILKFALSSTSCNPVEIAVEAMSLGFVDIHGPEHHFLDGALFLTAYCNAEKDPNLKLYLEALAERTIRMPGAMCGKWGVCGSAASIGAALSVLHGTGPLSSDGYYSDNMEFISRAVKKIGEVGGPRCCKRNAYISLTEASLFANEKYGWKIETTNPLKCRFFEKNRECIRSRCPFFPG